MFMYILNRKKNITLKKLAKINENQIIMAVDKTKELELFKEIHQLSLI
jgi:hypothetical protein